MQGYYYKFLHNHLQGDDTTWEIPLGTRLQEKAVHPNKFISECISAEWPVSFEKNAFEILHSAYMLLS